ncbi:MAG: ribonuclease III domain-containing protein [Bacilli bacterium]|jgi:ribonuclease-3 family protein|nr:ribonuclease III domain-containing protein [Bacilli bacterium]CDE96218.1 mini-ribonuclease 3 [Clostridium sp. CAG:914]
MNVDNINVLALAYLGDAIYEERVREYLIRSGISLVDDLQKETIRYVSAKNQARIISYLINTKYLTDREINIVKRGRNYKKNRHPRHTDIITYKLSTGFETLVGYLYLNNEKKRVEEIIAYILGGSYEENI